MTQTTRPTGSGAEHRGAATEPGSALASEPAASPAWWFLGTLAVLRNPPAAPLRPTVIELTLPSGGSPPRHIHDGLDDNFLLLDGELVVSCGDRSFMARPGSYVALPAGVPHTFRVVSSGPARMLLVHADSSFLEFIRAVGAPTCERRLPPAGAFDLDREALIRAAAEHDVRIIGAPLDELAARQAMAALASAEGGG